MASSIKGLFSPSLKSFHSAPNLFDISELCIFGFSCAIFRLWPLDHTIKAFIGLLMCSWPVWWTPAGFGDDIFSVITWWSSLIHTNIVTGSVISERLQNMWRERRKVLYYERHGNCTNFYHSRLPYQTKLIIQTGVVSSCPDFQKYLPPRAKEGWRGWQGGRLSEGGVNVRRNYSGFIRP